MFPHIIFDNEKRIKNSIVIKMIILNNSFLLQQKLYEFHLLYLSM